MTRASRASLTNNGCAAEALMRRSQQRIVPASAAQPPPTLAAHIAHRPSPIDDLWVSSFMICGIVGPNKVQPPHQSGLTLPALQDKE